MPPPTLAEFLNQAALEGYTQALFITSGTYTDKCRALADKKSSMKIQLMDLEDMLDYMEQTGLFPDENTIDRLIDREISSGNKKLQLIKKHLLMPKRIRTYLVYSLLFLVLSRIFGNMLIYYTLVSVFSLPWQYLPGCLTIRTRTGREKASLCWTRRQQAAVREAESGDFPRIFIEHYSAPHYLHTFRPGLSCQGIASFPG